jgi:NADPH2 dehydrogenase
MTAISDVSLLFQPLTVRGKTLRNRIVMPPMVTLRDLTSREALDWYGRRAHGCGLVIVEATGVPEFEDRLTAANLAPLVRAIHDGGALAAIQLFPIRLGREATPEGLRLSQVRAIVAGYDCAVQICCEAGFDGVEPHGAHGFLLNRFFSPEQNERTDNYGGSLDNRMRLGLDIVRAVRAAMGEDRLVLYRHTPVGDGYDLEESLALAERLVFAGVDILDISPASHEKPADRAEPFRKFGAPVIAVNDMDQVERAIEALAEKRADLVAVGRGLIADPDWPIKVREGRFAEIVKCTKCDQLCFGNLSAGKPVACTQWK